MNDLDNNLQQQMAEDELRDRHITQEMNNRLRERTSRAGKAVWRFSVNLAMVFNLLVFAICAIAVASGYYLYQGGKLYGPMVTYEQPCKITVGNTDIDGRRYYSYRFMDIMGYRFYDNNSVSERTELFVKGQGYVIVGHHADNTTWTSKVKQGEVGVEPLEAAATYTVFTNDNASTITYANFCRQSNREHPLATR